MSVTLKTTAPLPPPRPVNRRVLRLQRMYNFGRVQSQASDYRRLIQQMVVKIC